MEEKEFLGYCDCCGKPVYSGGGHYTHDRKDGSFGVLCGNSCFNKQFWIDTLDENVIIIHGQAYHTGDENSQSTFRGFGGARYKIRFKDTGKIIETTNLWNNGIIPKELYKEDNAEFIA